MVEQFFIAITGGIAIWLTQQGRESWKRYACLFGLAGQPFWFYTTWVMEQWGIFALTLLYTYAWTQGLWNHWIRK